MEKKWYAVYTKPKWEKKVSQNLMEREISNYCPLNKVVRQWSDRKKMVFEPLFTSYVFVNVHEKQFRDVRECDGIINMVHWLGKPAVIRNDEIDVIRKFLNNYSNVQIEKPNVHLYDRVRITQGPLMEMEGVVVVIKNNHVKVELPSLGCLMYANVDTSSVQVLNILPQHSSQYYSIESKIC